MGGSAADWVEWWWSREGINKHGLALIGISHGHSQSGQEWFLNFLSCPLIFFTMLYAYSKFPVFNSEEIPLLTEEQDRARKGWVWGLGQQSDLGCSEECWEILA